jgi:hypothetical protein
MKQQNRLLILWVIFGFILIHTLDSILYFSANLIVFLELKINAPLRIINYSYPIVVSILYLGTALILLRKIKLNSEIDGIYLKDFPKRTFIFLAIIGAILPLLTNYFNGIVISDAWETYSNKNNLGTDQYLEFIGSKVSSLGFNRIAIYIAVIIGFLYLNKRKTIANNGEHEEPL